ncbi:class I SAM-dependent methyltransferase [Halovenus marina]|uniref:class I SAM-dependent methyltransferase n=1 Tax=Halovenus marina TaxID=3396621 RepID=UPI003F552F90
MGHHTFDADRADDLERPDRYRYLSAEELLWALDLDGAATVADLGSGTGFYTDDVATHAETVYAVDIQEAMHEYYRAKGLPESVELVTSGVEELPFETDQLDAAFSTMTYHEFASDEAIAEVNRVLAPGSRLVIADWAATGEGESGPPLSERYTAEDAVEMLRSHGFSIGHEAVRPETFFLVVTV